mmetsp:Transcript_23365/g.55532  ORF Transcript_23365/g.55532 Transcript_23365/m.55532 type:complete len:559 (-) Transcript_23365:2099-3775(-)
MVRKIPGAAGDEVVHRVQPVAGFVGRRRPHLAGVGEDAHARQQRVPGHDGVAGAKAPSLEAGGQRLAGQPGHQHALQRVRQLHVVGIGPPVLGVGARVGLVVRHDVVARVLEAGGHLVVEALPGGRAEVALLQCADECGGGALHEQQGGGFQRLDEALRQPHRDAIAVPDLRHAADAHLQMPCRHVRVQQAQVAPQLGLGLVGRAVGAAVDIAVAAARGQRDLPRPAMAQRGGHGLRGDRAVQRCRHRDRRVIEEVLGKRDERRAQGLADQQRRKAGAVDEEVGGQGLPVVKQQAGDVARFVQLDPVDMALQVADAPFDGFASEELPEQGRIEVIAIPDVERKVGPRARASSLAGEGGRDEEAVRVGVHVGAVEPRMHVVHERVHGHVVQHRRERMEVALEARPGGPAFEGDAGLVGGVAGGHPFRLLNAQPIEETAQPGRRTLANADDADLRRLQHADLQTWPVGGGGQHQRRHPAGGTATDDTDMLDGWRRQRRAAGRARGNVLVEDGGGVGHGERQEKRERVSTLPLHCGQPVGTLEPVGSSAPDRRQNLTRAVR